MGDSQLRMARPRTFGRFGVRALIASTLAALGLALTPAGAHNGTHHALHDHYELDASLTAPYRAERAFDARTFKLEFAFPREGVGLTTGWRLALLSPEGKLIDEWTGTTPLNDGRGNVAIEWAGRTGKHAALPAGVYRAKMSAFATSTAVAERWVRNIREVEAAPESLDVDLIEQSWDFVVGSMPQPKMPAFDALPTAKSAKLAQSRRDNVTLSAPALNSLPYTVYFGNLHSQTNDSDGGGNVATCTSSQGAQTGQYGPADAFPYARDAGLDFLMTSEHNHYFDGSSGTNSAANPVTVKARYQSGLSAASNFNTANPNFLAIYGMEWGVIASGGHMNILNANELLGWESNASGQLLADTFTAKSDYAALYAVMKQKGMIGQFNHPDTSGQFLVGGTSLGYSADGDEVMVLTEVMNTSAFSNNTTETETGRSSFEGAFNLMLERGFHVAPSTNQDNHCANWGRSYTNRTGVLIPTGTPLTNASFIDALKARRVFASMDKNSQIVLTANGNLMGSRIQNSGTLNLVANFANSAGRTASTVTIYEGVPGRNGTVTALATTATATITPSLGHHFYWAKITQDDGKILWSAPVWVEQVTGTADTTPPAVSASATGTSGTITFAATASDNVGVTNVEFYLDGVLRGADATSPYSLAFDSTTVANGTYTLTARAYDAAGNNATSTAVSVTVSNTAADTTPPTVSASATGSSGTITFNATAADNVGVTNVEFYLNGVLRGADATAPYSLAFDSTTVANGTYTLTARAYDAAGNNATSTGVSVTVSNPVTTTFSEAESNGSIANANVVARSFTTITGTMGNSTDLDFYAITVNANERVNLTMSVPTGRDYDLYLVTSANSTLASSRTKNATETISYLNTTARTLYIRVQSVSGSSTTLPYSISVAYVPNTQLLQNPGFESGAANWTATSGVIDNSTGQAARTGSWKAWMNGYGTARTDTLYQQVAIPNVTGSVTLSFWLKVVSDETTTTQAFDTLKVQVRNTSNAVLTTLATYSNLNKGTTYVQRTFDVSAYKGQTVRVYFEGIEGTQVATSFLIDDVALTTQ